MFTNLISTGTSLILVDLDDSGELSQSKLRLLERANGDTGFMSLTTNERG